MKIAVSEAPSKYPVQECDSHYSLRIFFAFFCGYSRKELLESQGLLGLKKPNQDVTHKVNFRFILFYGLTKAIDARQ
jgi:hypothetical protein